MITGFLCPSDRDRLTDPNGHNNYMANSGSAPNSMYGGNANAPRWNGPVAGPFIYSDNGTGHPGWRQLHQHRGDHRRHEQHGRVQRAGQGDRQQFHGHAAPRSTAASRRRRSPRRPPSPTTLETTPQPYYQRLQREPARPATAIRTGPISSTTTSPARSGYRASRPTRATSTSCRPTPGAAARDLQIAHVANSHHPGGVNVLFCDGSVKFIKSTINITTWWALGTRAGGEVISSDQY